MADKSSWDERYAAKELVWSIGPNKRLAEEVATLAPGRALDIGCGEGRNAIYLAEQGWDVTAIDFSAVGVEKGAKIAAKRGVTVNWIVGDIGETQFPGSFDLVAVMFVHTDPEFRTMWLPRAIATIAPGGTFIYIGHDPAGIKPGVSGPQNPVVWASSDQICEYLDGFDVEFASVVKRPVADEPGHGDATGGVALDAVVRARRLMAK